MFTLSELTSLQSALVLEPTPAISAMLLRRLSEEIEKLAFPNGHNTTEYHTPDEPTPGCPYCEREARQQTELVIGHDVGWLQ
jgi:hypothetical protein